MPGYGQDLNNNRNARLSVIDFWVGAEGLSVDSATGWTNPGIIDPESLQLDFPTELFMLERGLPRSNKMQAVIKNEGRVSWKMDEYNSEALELALNSGPGVRTFATSPVATTVAAGAPTASGWNLTSATNFAVGQLIEVPVSGITYLTYIDTISGAAITVKPALPAAPAAAAPVKAVKRIENVIGTVVMARRAVRFVILDQNGEKISLWLPACSFKKTFSLDLGGGTRNMQLPMEVQAYSLAGTWNGISESIVARVYHDYSVVS